MINVLIRRIEIICCNQRNMTWRRKKNHQRIKTIPVWHLQTSLFEYGSQRSLLIPFHARVYKQSLLLENIDRAWRKHERSLTSRIWDKAEVRLFYANSCSEFRLDDERENKLLVSSNRVNFDYFLSAYIMFVFEFPFVIGFTISHIRFDIKLIYHPVCYPKSMSS